MGIRGLPDLSSSAVHSALRTHFNLPDPLLNLCVCMYLFCVYNRIVELEETYRDPPYIISE